MKATKDRSGISAPVSPLRGDELFFPRLASRDPTPNGSSSRIYYRACGQVPFDWESQPGKRKGPPESESVPPLSPPPAAGSAQLARRSQQYGVVSTPSRFQLWNSVVRTHKCQAGRRNRPEDCTCSVCDSSSSSRTSSMASPSSVGCFLNPLKVAMVGIVKRWGLSGALVCLFKGD